MNRQGLAAELLRVSKRTPGLAQQVHSSSHLSTLWGPDSATQILSKNLDDVSSFNCVRPLTPSTLFPEFVEWYTKMGSHSCPGGVYDYDIQMLSKCGPQGGKPTKAVFETVVGQYYQRPNRSINPPPEMLLARDLLIQKLVSLDVHYVHRHAMATTSDAAAGLAGAGHKTNSRRWEEVTESSMSVKNNGPFVPLPPIASWRRQRNGDRAVFMASWDNCAFLEAPLRWFRNTLLEHIPSFAAWSNPEIGVNPQIDRGLRKGFTWFEGDFSKKDQNQSLAELHAYVYPIWEVVFGDYFPVISRFVDNLFFTPVYVGSTLWLGKHTSLSGDGPIPESETLIGYLYNMALSIKYSHSDCTSLVLGDDILYGSRMTMDDAVRVLHTFSEWATLNGEVVNEEKCRVTQNSPRFCRKTYHQRGRRSLEGTLVGAYPVSLAVNSICHPEHPSDSLEARFIAICQVLDNVRGHELGATVAEFVLRRLDLHGLADVTTCKPKQDWWTKLYGETWDHKTSWAYRIAESICPCIKKLSSRTHD